MGRTSKAAAAPDKGKPPTHAAVTIPPPNMQVASFRIRGTTRYVQNKFSEEARQQIEDKQKAGETAKKGVKRKPKDFARCYEQSMYRMKDGSRGIPASCFRNAMISACRIVGFTMTRAKLALTILPDGYDQEEGVPLVSFTKGDPVMTVDPVQNATGVCDLRVRGKWEPGWEAVVRIRYDADMFALADIANLLHRAGLQVGVGAGRNDSKNSNGQGWGEFELVEEEP